MSPLLMVVLILNGLDGHGVAADSKYAADHHRVAAKFDMRSTIHTGNHMGGLS
jgi:hypothetical protein